MDAGERWSKREFPYLFPNIPGEIKEAMERVVHLGMLECSDRLDGYHAWIFDKGR